MVIIYSVCMECGAWREAYTHNKWNYYSAVPKEVDGHIEHSHGFCPPCREEHEQELLRQIRRVENGESI